MRIFEGFKKQISILAILCMILAAFGTPTLAAPNLVTSVFPANGDTEVATSTTVSFEFDTAVTAVALGGALIVRANGEVLNPAWYTLANESDNKVAITFPYGLLYSSAYEFIIDPSFAEGGYTLAFTTTDPIEKTETVIDFENYDVGTVLSPPRAQAYDDGVVNIFYNNTTEPHTTIGIAVDPVSSSKAMRIQYDNTNLQTNLKINLPDVTTGTPEVSFDFRTEQHRRYMSNFGKVLNKGGSAMNYGLTAGNDLRWQVQTPITKTLTLIDYTDYVNYKTVWHLPSVPDVQYGTHDVYVKLPGAADYTKKGEGYVDVQSAASGNSSIDYLYFTFAGRGGTGGLVSDSNTEYGIYWLDNVKLTVPSTINVLASEIADNQTGVNVNVPQTEMMFNFPLDSSKVNKDNIKLYKGDTPVDGYNVAYNASMKGYGVVMTFTEPLDYLKDYRIVLGRDIAMQGSATVTLGADRTINFTTQNIPFRLEAPAALTDAGTPITDLQSVLAQSISVNATVVNEGAQPKTYAVIATLISPDNKMYDVAITTGMVAAGNDAEITLYLGIPETIAAGTRIKCMMWDGYSLTAKSVHEPIYIP